MDRCDIIIPVWNQAELTEACISSIISNTDYPFRLIVIDNASDEKTRHYLDSVKNASGSFPVVLISNDKNLGFVKAVNQGITYSDAVYVCILNNDTLVTGGWLRELVNIADSGKDIGIVNPSSNNLGQRPLSGEPIELFAEKLGKDAGKFVELGAAIGFCMLIKRDVIKKIGIFDEIYGMGNFEDTDFSRRAVKAGYKCVRACGAYVYHRENASFDKMHAYEEDFKRNKEIYEFRWGKPRRIAYVLGPLDGNALKRLDLEAVRLARGGNWVWYYSRDGVDAPGHSNIKSERIGGKNFYLTVLLRILTKKKKFDEILVGEEGFGKVLERFSFIHKASVNYY